jgi:hypothetical protein
MGETPGPAGIRDMLSGSEPDPEFLAAPQSHARRRMDHPAPGTPLTVKNPQIKDVMVVETGVFTPVEAVIGTELYELMQLRMKVRTAMHREQPLYLCSTCFVPVFLCCAKDEKRFYFKHRHEDGNCPSITRSELSQEELDARKYNGAKESQLHIRMKEWLVACLQIDGRFQNIAPEKRWKGAVTGEWRRPDVRATYNDMPVAFEVQLSTTYLNVIAERRQFYLEQGGLLFWIFSEFDSERLRMTEEDVFYNNNQNAFVVSSRTVAHSLANKEFYLGCIWAEPTRDGGTSAFHRKRVSFHELTLEPASQRAYYFDFDGRRQQLREEVAAQDRELRGEIETWWDSGRNADDGQLPAWTRFRARLRHRGIPAPASPSEFGIILLTVLYSAKNNRPWGHGFNKLIQVAHSVGYMHKDYWVWFMHALAKYGRLEGLRTEGDPKKWAAKQAFCEQELKTSPELYEPDRQHQPLVEYLFPELCPLP